MIISSLTIVAPPNKRKEIQKTFHSLLPFIRLQSGCSACNVYQDLENHNTIVIQEKWQTTRDLHRYIRSEQYRKILALMDLSIMPPEISFNEIATIEGMDLIESIRT